MGNIDFTIITPNLNGGRFLRECLESVRDQVGASVEHWMIDGGSSDTSLAIAADFPDVQVLVEKDEGMSDAINKGFDRAKGGWVMWLNADDRMRPGALQAVKAFADNHPDADLIYGNISFIDEHGQETRKLKLPRWSRFVHVHHCCYIPSTACFLKNQSVLQAGFRLRVDFKYVMDGEFYARLDAAGKKVFRMTDCLADFRWHGNNASIRHLGKSRDMDRILEAERQHVESRAIRRMHGITLFMDPYLNGLADGLLWLVARAWKSVLRLIRP